AKVEDWRTPLLRMVSQGKTEAVRALLAHGADAAARHPDGRDLTQVAQEKGLHEVAALLQQYAVKT
ncbi:MAG TPA: hypothetical protein VGY94_07225, partial [Acidobacteriaceae bacterium]|nr:hypothetical protein [Acidobacteriaceae bacterium]